ncbi:Target of Myb protein 1 [Trichostrongylus colubriformis]|uniref:Target of Myb protein 1 n=1 Tax=Trichostrongylus colubriformis TaxID=6319 RepID=A0AAN8IVG1_TRICO
MSNVSEQVSKTMESAKEAAAKVGEQVSDFFQGNPFSTPVGRKIELATNASILATENWGLNMEICDFINSTEDGAKDAVRAIRKRLHTNMCKNNAIVMYTLTVLETCVKNCGHNFHVLVCSKDFVQDLVKLIGSKFDTPQIIHERVLSLIQAWADAFRGHPDLQGVVQVYDELVTKGVTFPATDLDAMAPIITPKQTVFTEPRTSPLPPQPSHSEGARSYEVVSHADGPITATAEQLAKLRSDLDVVNSNLKVFREMLTEIIPGRETADELQLLNELHATCKQMQLRVLDLIRSVGNEEVTYELLVMNDEFNSVFEKYDRFMTNRTGDGTGDVAAAPAQQEVGDLIDVGQSGKPLEQQLAGMKVTSASTSDAYSANNEPQAAIGIATAINSKNGVSDVEAKEMESWLAAQEKPADPPKKTDDDKL